METSLAIFYSRDMNANVLLADWLHDVLEREHALLHGLETYADSLDQSDPELGTILKRYAEQTRAHTRGLGDLLAQIGEEKEPRRTTVITEAIATITATIPRDGALRRMTDLWTSTQDIMILDAAIVSAARSSGNTDIAMAVETYLAEERTLADWLQEYIPEVAKTLVQDAS